MSKPELDLPAGPSDVFLTPKQSLANGEPSNLDANMDRIPSPLPEGRMSRAASITASYLHLDAEKVINAFGKYGRYQMIAYAITNIVSLLYVMNMMVMPFISEEPEFSCNIQEPNGVKWEYEVVDKCSVVDNNNWTIQCTDIPGASYKYDDTVHSTMSSEFNLVCQEHESTEHASAIFLFGGMLAAPIVTQLSDLIGRRWTFLVPLYLSVVCNLLASVAPTYTTFLALRFFSGFGTIGFASTAYVLCAESVSTTFRDLIPLFPTFIWVGGYMLTGVFRQLIGNWRWLYFAVSAGGILTIPLWWWTPESLHWLINNNKHREVKKYIARSSHHSKAIIDLSECKNENTLEKQKRTILDLFTHKGIFLQLCLNAGTLIVMNGTYWALSLFSTDLSEYKMTSFYLSGIVELPAGIIGSFLMTKLNRKTIFSWALVLQGAAMLCAVAVPDSKTLKMVFPLLAKSFNGVAWAVQPVIAAEIAPTTVRNSFTGVVCFLGDVGSIAAPYLKRLEALHPMAPGVLIGLLSFVAAVLVLAMPETKDQKLPEDLDSMDPGPLFDYLEKRKKAKKTSLPNRKETVILLEPIPEGAESERSSEQNLPQSSSISQ